MANISFKIDRKKKQISLDGLVKSIRKEKNCAIRLGIVKETNRVIKYDGTTIANVGAYIEYGWTQTTTPKQDRYLRRISGGFYHARGGGHNLRLPPRPFISDTVAQKKRSWARLFAKRLTISKYSIEKALHSVGNQAVKDIRQTLRWNQYEKRSELTLAIAKAQGHFLRKKFGIGSESALWQAISYRVDK